jgi:CheY-like chemotaxis protein
MGARGDEVPTALTHESPDLVLLDARLPCLEPATFVRAWRATAPRERVPVVVLSVLAEVPDPPCRLSAVAPMRKPFDLDEYSRAWMVSAAGCAATTAPGASRRPMGKGRVLRGIARSMRIGTPKACVRPGSHSRAV